MQPPEALVLVIRVVDREHDERAVLEHVGHIHATPSPGGRLDEGSAFVNVGDHPGGSGTSMTTDCFR